MRRWTSTLQAISCAAACASAIACGSSTDTSLTAPSTTPSRCQPSFDNTSRSFGPDGGTGNVAVTVARECSWSATSGASWVVITSGATGQGDGTVAFRVDRNPDPVSRGGAIVVGETRVDVAQQPAACRYDVARPDGTVGAQGGAVQLQIRAHDACAWSAASESSWMSVSPPSGRGNATISITVAVNTGTARSGVVVVAGERLPVAQSASGPAPAPPAPTPPAPSPTPPPPSPPPPAPPPTEVQLSGRVADLSGRCPTVRFEVSGTIVVTTEATSFRHGSCRDLKNKMDVVVIGRRLADGSVEARDVELNRDD